MNSADLMKGVLLTDVVKLSEEGEKLVKSVRLDLKKKDDPGTREIG